MKRLFLVSGKVTRHYFIDGEGPTTTETRLVYARTEDEAKRKFKAYWTSRDTDLGCAYLVDCMCADEAIR